MQIPKNINSYSAYDIAQLLHNKKISPIELVNYYDKIESFSRLIHILFYQKKEL